MTDDKAKADAPAKSPEQHVKLNLNLAGYGAKDDVLLLDAATAEAFIERGHADPYDLTDAPAAAAGPDDADTEPQGDDPLQKIAEGANLDTVAAGTDEAKKAPAKATAKPAAK